MAAQRTPVSTRQVSAYPSTTRRRRPGGGLAERHLVREGGGGVSQELVARPDVAAQRKTKSKP